MRSAPCYSADEPGEAYAYEEPIKMGGNLLLASKVFSKKPNQNEGLIA